MRSSGAISGKVESSSPQKCDHAVKPGVLEPMLRPQGPASLRRLPRLHFSHWICLRIQCEKCRVALHPCGTCGHQLEGTMEMTQAEPKPEPMTIAVGATRRVSGLLLAPASAPARACYVLAHGAGAGMTHPFMAAVATGLAG